MKEGSRTECKRALTSVLMGLDANPLQVEGHWEYQRKPGGWSGTFVAKPSLTGVWDRVEPHVPRVRAAMEQNYPLHMKFLGTGLGGGPLDPAQMLVQLVADYLERFGSFRADPLQIDALLEEAGRFLEAKTVRIRLSAPALNTAGERDVPPVSFPGDIILRPVTDRECTEFYGGNPIFRSRGMSIAFPEFVFVTEVEVPLAIGDSTGLGQVVVIERTREALEKCLLALATFKDGPIGYDGIFIRPVGIALGVGMARGHLGANEHVPFSRYQLSAGETATLQAHANKFEHLHAALEIAAQRLADSSRRPKPRDAILDSIIGLESILLYQKSSKEKSEMRFRFALNYAALHDASDRMKAFSLARGLYDLRSAIAHGDNPKEPVKIKDREMTLRDAANESRTILRSTWNRFAQNPKDPEFARDEFWLRTVLAVT